MKIALITDTHWGARGDSLHFIDFYEKFYKDTFFPTLEKENIDTVLMLGDTFDRRKYVNFVTLKRAKEIYFDELQKRGIKAFVLVGNHDTSYKNTNDVNSPNLLLEEYSNIITIGHPSEIRIGQTDDNPLGTQVCMIPWICPENYQECLQVIEDTDAPICCGHFEIAGFAMYRGHPCEEGLNRDIFRKFEFTFSGHYHHRSSADGIHYLGNPYELTWQDYNDTRGFHILDLETRELTFVPNPNVMFHRIIYDDKEESITDITNKDLSKYTNTYVKVVVINKTNPYLFDKFMSNLYDVNPIDVTIAEDFTDLTEGVEDDMIDQSKSTLDLIYDYIDSTKQKNVDATKLKNMVRELYVEALNKEE